MLISLEVENWKSFKQASLFTMLSSKERKHAESLAKLPASYNHRKVLPVAAVFGANSSGKTTIIEALSLLKSLVVYGLQVDQGIPVEGYRLDPATSTRPTTFTVEFLKNERIYRYRVGLSRSRIEEETLQIKKSSGYRTIYSRIGSDINFGKGFENDRFKFIAQGTRTNQLLLHNAIAQNAEEFRPAFDWFYQTLRIEGIDAHGERHAGMLLRDDFQDFINERLYRYNTGADRIALTTVDRSAIPIHPRTLDDIIRTAPIEESGILQIRTGKPDSSGTEIFISEVKRGQEPLFKKVMLIHKRIDGQDEPFDLSEESTGTQRLVELLPLFFDLAAKPKDDSASERVYMIDEMGRSFHTALTNDLIESFLESCDEHSRHQLIFTTHDLTIMLLDTLRRDEMWVCQKDTSNGSTVFSLGKLDNARHDSNLLNNYIKGLYGGFPRFRRPSVSDSTA